MSEFERENAEAVDMVRAGQQFPRAKVHFLSEADYRCYQEYMDAKAIEELTDPETVVIQNLIKRIGGTIARVFPAVIFFAGAAEGLMDLYFAGALTLPCLFWAVGFWMWGGENGTHNRT